MKTCHVTGEGSNGHPVNLLELQFDRIRESYVKPFTQILYNLHKNWLREYKTRSRPTHPTQRYVVDPRLECCCVMMKRKQWVQGGSGVPAKNPPGDDQTKWKTTIESQQNQTIWKTSNGNWTILDRTQNWQKCIDILLRACISGKHIQTMFSFLLKNSMYCKSNHVTIFYVLVTSEP